MIEGNSVLQTPQVPPAHAAAGQAQVPDQVLEVRLAGVSRLIAAYDLIRGAITFVLCYYLLAAPLAAFIAIVSSEDWTQGLVMWAAVVGVLGAALLLFRFLARVIRNIFWLFYFVPVLLLAFGLVLLPVVVPEISRVSALAGSGSALEGLEKLAEVLPSMLFEIGIIGSPFATIFFLFLVWLVFPMLTLRGFRIIRSAFPFGGMDSSYSWSVLKNTRIDASAIGLVLGLAGILLFTSIVGSLVSALLFIPGLALARDLYVSFWQKLNRQADLDTLQCSRSNQSLCLYLRSFDDDSVRLEGGWRTLVRYLPTLRFLTWFIPVPEPRTEEVVVRTIWPYHAVVAIGYARDDDSPLGAVRLPVTEDDWQQVVRERAGEASLVVLQAGFSPGVKWEHGHLRGLGSLSKTLVLFPPESRADQRDRWETLLQTGYFQPTPVPEEDVRHHTLFVPAGPDGLAEHLAAWQRAAGKRLSKLGRAIADLFRRKHIVDRTIACGWTPEGVRIHFTAPSKSRIAYELALRLACAPQEKVLKAAFMRRIPARFR